MLAFEKEGSGGPLLFLLHWLGGSAETWKNVSSGLAARGLTVVSIDLPGFGHSASSAGDDVAAVTAQVLEVVRHLREECQGPSNSWAIAGHSMGGKIALIITRRALDGEPGLENLRALALVSASPPGPEPMSDQKRADLLEHLGQSAGSAKVDRKQAAAFVDENTGKLPLLTAVRERAIDGVLTMRRTAFRAWLEHGSREDWSERVGALDLPAAVFAGTADSALGPQAQRQHLLPHLTQAMLVELPNTAHLAPLECPGELIEQLTIFLSAAGFVLRVPEEQPGPHTLSIMHSTHTSPRTLEVMQDRLVRSEDWNYEPSVFSVAEFRTLRALAAAVVPHAGFDVAACLEAQLAQGKGDGWRFSELPEDCEAWRRGLASLDAEASRRHSVSFLGLSSDQQLDLLRDAAAGKVEPGLLNRWHLGDSVKLLSAGAMEHWFEDVRAEFTRIYMGDPRTMNRIGYTGFADDLGFTLIQLDQPEEF